MIWDEVNPTTSTAANTIATYLQNAKKMSMERMKSTNTFDEHDVFGTSATGFHVKSKIGWVKVFTTEAALIAFIPKPKGAMYYALDTDALYIVLDDVGSIEKVATTDHSQLTGRDDDDHSQYYLKSGTRSFGNWIYVDSVSSVITDGTNDDEAMSSAHITQSWYTAHNADGGPGVEHFADGCASSQTINHETTTSGFDQSWGLFWERLDWYYWGGTGQHNFFPVVTEYNPLQTDFIGIGYNVGSFMTFIHMALTGRGDGGWTTRMASRISSTTVAP